MNYYNVFVWSLTEFNVYFAIYTCSLYIVLVEFHRYEFVGKMFWFLSGHKFDDETKILVVASVSILSSSFFQQPHGSTKHHAYICVHHMTTTVYSYFMPVQGTVKTIDPRCWRWLGNLPSADRGTIVLTVPWTGMK
jgi:hypothetical protein